MLAVVFASPDSRARGLATEGRGAALDTVLRIGAGQGSPVTIERGGMVLAAWQGSARLTVDSARATAHEGWFEGALEGFFKGEFALAQLHDGGAVLARGRFGGRPFYWTRTGNGWMACSDLPALVGALGRRPALDRRRLAALAVYKWAVGEDTTVYEGVSQLRSGEVLRLGRDGSARSTFPDPAPLSPLAGDADALAEALRAELFRSVKRAIDGKQRVAVLAGGGVDSSGILAASVALARGASKADVLAMCLDFASVGDDRPYMRALADDLGIVPLRFPPSAFASHVRRALVMGGCPYTWPTGGWELGLAEEAKRRGAEVILTGTGGDDLLDGDPTWLAARVLQGKPAAAVRDALALRLPWPSTKKKRLWQFVLRPLLVGATPFAVRHAMRRMRTRKITVPWAGPELEHVLRLTEKPHSRALRPPTPGEHFQSMAYAPVTMQYAEVRVLFEAETACAAADPYLDEELVRFVAALPPEMMFYGGRLRGLFRHALKGLVVDRVRLRPDKARFSEAGKEMLQAGEGLGTLRDLADMRTLDALGIVNGRAYAAAFERFVRCFDEDSLDLWPALALEAFARGQA